MSEFLSMAWTAVAMYPWTALFAALLNYAWLRSLARLDDGESFEAGLGVFLAGLVTNVATFSMLVHYPVAITPKIVGIAYMSGTIIGLFFGARMYRFPFWLLRPLFENVRERALRSSLRARFNEWREGKARANARRETDRRRSRKEILERFDEALDNAREAFLRGRESKETLEQFVEMTKNWRELLEQLLDRRDEIANLINEIGATTLDDIVRDIDSIEPTTDLARDAAEDIAAAKNTFEIIRRQAREVGAGIEKLLLKAKLLPVEIASARAETVLAPHSDEGSLRLLLAEPLPAPGLPLRPKVAE